MTMLGDGSRTTQAAGEFVRELLDLGSFRRPKKERQVFTTAPLRGAKEGQEGQWRVISDMLRGARISA
jgi:hypothetical protein